MITRAARVLSMVLLLFVAVTAVAGGVLLILGGLDPTLGSVFVPPASYLERSPFTSYAFPGLLLIVLVAAPHAAAFVSTVRSGGRAALLTATSGFACIIWIFVQMIYIPFSWLQATYFVIGLLELGFALLTLGVLARHWPEEDEALIER